MTPYQIAAFIFIGITAGILSGLFGIGGGIVIVPLLIWVAGMTQHQASGTSLVALLLPVGLLGVWEYYKSGKIGPLQMKSGAIMAIGLFLGAFLGAKIAQNVSPELLRKGFVFVLIGAAVKLWFS